MMDAIATLFYGFPISDEESEKFPWWEDEYNGMWDAYFLEKVYNLYLPEGDDDNAQEWYKVNELMNTSSCVINPYDSRYSTRGFKYYVAIRMSVTETGECGTNNIVPVNKQEWYEETWNKLIKSFCVVMEITYQEPKWHLASLLS